jgi:putative endonuclease
VLAAEGVLVICEVKARQSMLHGAPADAVNWAKQRKLRQLAVEYLGSHAATPTVVRFDVAEVVGSRVTVIHDAF